MPAVLIRMRSPKTGRTYGILQSRVIGCMKEGWRLVDKADQLHYQNRANRILPAMVVYGD